MVGSRDVARKDIDDDSSRLMEDSHDVGMQDTEHNPGCLNMIPMDTDSNINDSDKSVSASSEETAELGKFGCVPCQKSFRDNYPNLQSHVRLVHLPRSEPILCTRTWCNQEILIRDKMLAHREGCLLRCPQALCTRAFSKVGRYEMHLRSHLSMAKRMSD